MRYARDRLRRESEIQAEIKAFYEALGCSVASFSQHRKGSGTQQTEGIADLCAFPPARPSWWHEVKTPDGTQSAEQKRFQAWVLSSGGIYLLGGIEVGIEQCVRVGLLRPSIFDELRAIDDRISRLRVSRQGGVFIVKATDTRGRERIAPLGPVPRRPSVHGAQA